MSSSLFKGFIGIEIPIGLIGVGCGILLFVVTTLLAIWRKKQRTHTIKRAVILAIIAIALSALLFLGLALTGEKGIGYLILFLLIFPVAFIQGIIVVYALIELYLALSDKGVFLPHLYRGILCIVGASLALIAFYFLPMFSQTYAPPANFPTDINGVHVTAFSNLIYYNKLVNAPIDLPLIGVTLPFSTLFGLIFVLLFGLLSLRWEAFPLLVATQFLFVAELLFFYFLFILWGLEPGGVSDQARENFQKVLGNTGQAVDAAQYLTYAPAAGFYVLALAFLLIGIAMFAPAPQNESAGSSMRSLLISIGLFALFLVLTHLPSLNATVTSWQHQTGIIQFIGNQIESVATAGFWPLIGGILGSIIVVMRQRNAQAVAISST